MILTVVACAIFGDQLAPLSPIALQLDAAESPPAFLAGGDSRFLLGTDRLGRDILSRIIVGSRTSSLVAIVAITVAAVVGTSLGVLAGYAGSWVDAVIMRVVDAMFALPSILVALLLAMTIGPSLQNVIFVLVIVLWARYARLVRGEVLRIKQRDFVIYARVAGASPLAIAVKHLVPHVSTSVIILSTLQIGNTILTEASLSFLGAGVPPPTPTWGGMVTDGRTVIETSWWISIMPGIVIMLVVLAFNLMGDWIRDLLDPQRRPVL
jgi:peptide/nickel transport system permease protein